MANAYRKKGSKKQRLFEKLAHLEKRLKDGVIIVIALEEPLEQANTAINTFRVYWSEWRRQKRLIQPAENAWLEDVEAKISADAKGVIASLWRKDAIQALVERGQVVHSHTVYDTRGQGAQYRGEAAKLTAEQEAVFAAQFAGAPDERWPVWIGEKGNANFEKHEAAMRLSFDSPEAQAYRTKVENFNPWTADYKQKDTP